MLSESRNEIVRCQSQQSRFEQAVLPLKFSPTIVGNPNFGGADSRPFDGSGHAPIFISIFCPLSSDFCPLTFSLLSSDSAPQLFLTIPATFWSEMNAAESMSVTIFLSLLIWKWLTMK